MKVFIVGGTGFLGYYATLEFLRRDHSVSTIAIPDVTLGSWFPVDKVKIDYNDVFKMSSEDLVKFFKGFDAMVYAVGPDDRFVPKAPAYDFFHERLVNSCTKVVNAAREAGIKKCVVLSSYFCYFDRIWPERHLSEHHPYIKVRNEQAESVIAAGQGKMEVMTLELPYIFGEMPGRVPLWKEALYDRVKNMHPIMYPKGGTTMITVEHVAEAIVGAVENGKHGMRYPVGDVNMEWKEMLTIMFETMGRKAPRVITIPTFLGEWYGNHDRKKDFKLGKESGLHHGKLFPDIQSQKCFIDPTETIAVLKYNRGGVKEAIITTIKACIAADKRDAEKKNAAPVQSVTPAAGNK
jgi:nucleoside-diphosphate-sugar epimerase